MLLPLWFTVQSCEAMRVVFHGLVSMKHYPLDTITPSCGWQLSEEQLSQWDINVKFIHVFLCFSDELKEKLQDFVSETNSQRPGFIKIVRHAKQEGLIDLSDVCCSLMCAPTHTRHKHYMAVFLLAWLRSVSSSQKPLLLRGNQLIQRSPGSSRLQNGTGYCYPCQG